MSLLEKAILAVAILIGITGTILSHTSPDFFTKTFTTEDGVIEWLTVIALVASATLTLKRVIDLRRVRPPLFLFGTAMAALVFLFGAGEEISWGQRIFALETPDWLEAHNKQNEINIHNLVIGGHSINKVVFSNGLGLLLLIYLLVIPAIYRKSPSWAAWIDGLGVPMPRTWHVIAWISFLLLTELVVGTDRRFELGEMLLTTTLFLQLLRPLNDWIYDRERELGSDGKLPL